MQTGSSTACGMVHGGRQRQQSSLVKVSWVDEAYGPSAFGVGTGPFFCCFTFMIHPSIY